MCGLTGFFNQHLDKAALPAILKTMTDAISYRGPDDAGYWVSDSGHLALGHRRLAIQDLSAAGHQPMFSENKRYIMVYNGEVYNFETLRDTLQQRGHPFIGHCDTEVLLAAIVEWGVAGALKHFNGMFAFALYDIEHNLLHLARDRVGIKPLYYGWQGNTFLFGSEIKALLPHPDFNKRINRQALSLFMRYLCIPQPFSIYEGIKKLPPGHLFTLSLTNKESKLEAYWEPKNCVQRPKIIRDEETLLSELDAQLKKSIRYQMKADVDYGAFLSGGIDSSLIVALMQAQSSTPIKTFSIGFHDQKYDEAAYAKAIATHLKTEHHEHYIDEQDALRVIPKLATIYDEPFADSSQIPTYLVSEFAKQHVTISLSGDGGDELFAGYHRHFLLNSLWHRIAKSPRMLRHLVGAGLDCFSPDTLERYIKRFSFLMPPAFRASDYANKIYKLKACLKASNIREAYANLVMQWRNAENVVLNGAIPLHTLNDTTTYPDAISAIESLMYLDFMTYLPDDLLCKVDRASMAVSLEARVPFLDHHFIEFAWSIPLEQKIQGHQGKYILKQLLARYIPHPLFDRPKMGFSLPLEHWLRGELRDWANNLLDLNKLTTQGFFDPVPIQAIWQAHQAGKQNHHNLLWPILMFQAWYAQYF